MKRPFGRSFPPKNPVVPIGTVVKLFVFGLYSPIFVAEIGIKTTFPFGNKPPPK